MFRILYIEKRNSHGGKSRVSDFICEDWMYTLVASLLGEKVFLVTHLWLLLNGTVERAIYSKTSVFRICRGI